MTEFRFMRVLVFFDLPVVSKVDKRRYISFRKFLLKDGYDMLQYSIYSRLCNGMDAMGKHLLRLENNVPPKGAIRSLCLTDKQYARMILWVGKPTKIEKTLKNERLTLI
ncbi:MAG: CRISPR-associated endonuclease Cas2 [Candidatus Zeuxoniibacter abyssi]|nr:MAG: CRISPR-associated endonuclease Cas2 [Candidatus Persebacteraceae bacterium AB1(2)]